MKILTSLLPAVRAADANGATISRMGWGVVTHLISVGTQGIQWNGTNYVQLKLQESSNGAAWSVPAQSEVSVPIDQNGVFAVLDDDTDDEQVYRIDYTGDQRYVRIVVDFVGTHATGTAFSAVAVLWNGVAEGGSPLPQL